MASSPIQYARSPDGTSIACTVVGDGPPLLILGALGLTIGYPTAWHSSLLYDFRHAIFDRRGSGSSGPVNSASMDQLMQDAVAVVDHLGFASLHVFGFGMGCVETIRLAIEYPGRIRGVVLVNPVPSDWPAQPRRRAWRAALDTDWDYFADTAFRTGGTPEQPPSAAQVRHFKESNNAPGFRGVVNALAEAGHADLGRVSVPAIVVQQASQGRGGLHVAARQAGEIPGAVLVNDRGSDDWHLSSETEELLRGFFIRTMPPDEVPASWLVQKASPAHAGATAVLSDREQEVLRLVAGGLSNRDIAAALVIAEPTVASHLRHILDKLGVENRAGAAAWAVREGLA